MIGIFDSAAGAAPQIGQEAPDLTAVDSKGIDKDGTLRYMGGIDSLATTDEADIARAEPYLKEAMLAVAAGDPEPHPVTKPYGCSIKY